MSQKPQGYIKVGESQRNRCGHGERDRDATLNVEEGPRARVGRSPVGARRDRKENLPENPRKERGHLSCSSVRELSGSGF